MATARRRFQRHAAAAAALIMAATAWWNTDFVSPPRFDGAGYAVLAESLTSGRGYREIDRPDSPRHAHFPPGYPAALAALWRVTGRSAASAHAFSLACTVAATLAAWRWFRTMYSPRVAGLLGLALACNWTWERTGGAIQSEPMFLLLQTLALLAAARAGRCGGVLPGVVLGALLAACALTRQVAVALAAAVVLDLLLRRRRASAAVAVVTCLILVIPWVVWLTNVRGNTQAGLLQREGLADRVVSQGLFYVQRLPDQLTGPFVEIGTVFQRRAAVAVAVNAWAVVATGLLVLGWTRAVRSPRRRLAGLTAFATLALLLVWPFTEAGRFLIPLVPCLLVGAVEGVGAVASMLRLRRPRTLAAALLLAAALPYSVYALATNRADAQRRTHAGFDAACAWIAREARAPGPVLTLHPGEVYWQTGRNALGPGSDNPEAVAAELDRFGVAYILADEERFANASANPLSRFARSYPGRCRQVWSRDAGGSSVRVYEVSGSGPRSGAGRSLRIGGSSAGGAGPNS